MQSAAITPQRRGIREPILVLFSVAPLSRAGKPARRTEVSPKGKVGVQRGRETVGVPLPFCARRACGPFPLKGKNKAGSGSTEPALLRPGGVIRSQLKEKSKKERKKRDSQLLRLRFAAFVLFFSTFLEQLQYSPIFVEMQEKSFGSLYKKTRNSGGRDCALRGGCEKPISVQRVVCENCIFRLTDT